MPSPSNRSRGDDSPTSSTTQFHPGFDAGILPVIPDGTPPPDKPPTSNAATGASAAGVRALTSQAVAFYFRAPVKAFFRTRVDYLAYARALQEQEHGGQAATSSSSSPPSTTTTSTSTPSKPPTTPRWTTTTTHWLRTRLRSTTPAVLASAVRHYGWRVVPDQILPPLVANVGVGAVLYTSYLQILGRLHPESARASKRVYPPPGPGDAFAAGFLAGGVQSVVAAPLDAVQARWDGVTSGRVVAVAGGGGGGAVQRPRSMWVFSAEKLREIGVRGVFSGWGLSFLKDSMGSAVFFSVFEYVKAQGYYNFVRWFYGSLNEDTIVLLSRKRPAPEDGPQLHPNNNNRSVEEPSMPTIIRPHYAIEPAFLLLAGMSASVTQQAILHPLSHVQAEHWERLEALDAKAAKLRREAGLPGAPPNAASRWRMLRAYRAAYRKTWAECMAEAEAAGLGMRQWLYRGFWWNTLRQVPSTSAGLIIFELVRRKYGFGGDQVRINRDGYDILLH
ncbi:mitochondrial carrier domain-containing protein [Chaetomium tenue]|uniref:Mitochondrial carrier domain-containing protein n=1 Tax=Chaetomium tenue TaxID=1854479 RepID=A0ACB7PPK5_9PEZI|nr:mitochondrial carrier domain-containing protein [Chaetomium globosum]